MPESRAAQRSFDRAARSFDSASVVHDECRERLLERLDFVRLAPSVVVDAGCATGRGAAALAARYPQAKILALDSSLPMLEAARRAAPPNASVRFVAGDAENLPLGNGHTGLIFANMLLPWVRPQNFFPEAARALSEGGLLLFATLGPDSLEQVRRAWASVDENVHVHAFFDMHDLGDLAMASGLAEPVVDVDRIAVTYRDVNSMIRDLRACGATNVAGGRRRGLTGRRAWERFAEALVGKQRGGRLAITFELILGHAWAVGARPRASGAGGEASVPVEDIGIIRRSRR